MIFYMAEIIGSMPRATRNTVARERRVGRIVNIYQEDARNASTNLTREDITRS